MRSAKLNFWLDGKKRGQPYGQHDLISCQNGADVLAGRRLKKRSLLKVNEHFSDKPDDADAPLSQ